MLERESTIAFLDYAHNDTDRMFVYLNGTLVYLNGTLVYKSHNHKLCNKDVTAALKQGDNDMTILYANEFHNKSHPHEGALVKYSGIMRPFHLHGVDQNGEKFQIDVSESRLL